MSLRFTIQELTEYVEEIFTQIKDDFEYLKFLNKVRELN